MRDFEPIHIEKVTSKHTAYFANGYVGEFDTSNNRLVLFDKQSQVIVDGDIFEVNRIQNMLYQLNTAFRKYEKRGEDGGQGSGENNENSSD